MSDLRIAPMTLDQLRLAVDWAAAEGWNPGLEDAECFHAVDPEGVLMGWIGNTPVTAISVVRHSDEFGFLGFYLCHPDHRGKGHGMATWKAGIAHLGDRAVGLDGVPAQEENYKRSGFSFAHYTKRYAGAVAAQRHSDCRNATPADLEGLLQMDLEISGTGRVAYLTAMLARTRTRRTMVCETAGRIAGFGTIRACHHGHKIGPLFCPDATIAARLMRALVAEMDADNVYIDIPDPNVAAVELARSLGLEPVFSCARMYRGGHLDRRTARIFGETTFELG